MTLGTPWEAWNRAQINPREAQEAWNRAQINPREAQEAWNRAKSDDSGAKVVQKWVKVAILAQK